MRTHILTALGAATLSLACSSIAGAASNPYLYSLDTTAFLSNSAGPFYLDFQLVQGNGGSNNTVTLGNFNFDASHGGSAGAVYAQASGTPFVPVPAVEPAGGASGSAASSVVLTDNSSVNASAGAFNELIEAFTPGDTLSFSAAYTTNGLVNTANFTPDEFSFSILKKTGADVPSTAPDGASLLTATFGSPLVTIATYTPLITATSVPLPPPLALALLALPFAAFSGCRWRKPATARI